MDIISLQSHVSRGYVGNASAVPVIEALGHSIRPVHSVTLEHHPGHGPVERHVTSPDEIAQDLSDAFEAAKGPVLFHMGYLGSREQGEAALSVLSDARKKGGDICFHIDPAFGDTKEGIYVPTGIVDLHRTETLKHADIFKGNAFEAATLSGVDIASEDDAVQAAKAIHERGPGDVIITSVPTDGDRLSNILVSGNKVFAARVQKRPLLIKGTGDIFAAAYLSAISIAKPPEDALGLAASLVEYIASDAAERELSEPDIERLRPTLSPDMRLISVEALVAHDKS